ncbi:MAG: hypothetical protein JWM64_629 [Frankiales bacterium]|nr:hypothetical protein [Frankiales bacterium]
MTPRVGLCGWTISQAAYARRFPLLEVQHTFYDPPDDALLARWRRAWPAGAFTLKAWQLVTHESGSPTYRRLRTPLPAEHRGQVGGFRTTPPVLQAWQRTLECARVLAAEGVLLQCPASFRPTPENVGRLRSFLGEVERPAGRLLWEPRGAWPGALLTELCAELDLVHVVDPFSPGTGRTDTVTPERTYYRLHGTTGMRHVHTDEELRHLRDLVADRPDACVLFNNLPRAGDAERFQRLLGQADEPCPT